ncbi:S8 family serine peptidase, partial [bacterium]|nr:S8 family serine peptidase [bacterium]
MFKSFIYILILAYLHSISFANSSDFTIFKERYFPNSKGLLPPLQSAIDEYKQLGEVGKYLYLEDYFSGSQSGRSANATILINAHPKEFEELNNQLQLKIVNYLPKYNIYEVSTPSFYSSSDFLKKLKAISPLIDIEENSPLKLFAPNRNAKTPWQAINWPVIKSQINKDFPNKLRTITIGILDTGLSPHYDLMKKGKLKNDSNGHGTHVAGIINAVQKNNRGIEGISPNSKLMIYKVLDNDNSGNIMALISALIQAKRDRCQIVNMSLGTYQNSRILYNILTKLSQDNILMIAAAGNDHTSELVLPASHPAVIGVASYSSPIALSHFSNFGENFIISLPGENIISTHLNNKIIPLSGTSMAAPMLTGIMAEIYSSMIMSPSLDSVLDSFED